MNEIKGTKDLLKITAVVDDEEVAKYEEQQKKINREKAYEDYKSSGVPSKFFESSLDTFNAETDEEKRNLETARDFAKNPKNRIIVMCGNNGNGKSHLSCGMLKVCGGEYVTSSQLCIEYEAAISYHAKRTREEMLKHYTKVSPLLVIDECGKYTVNPALEQFILSYILCTRYENNLASDVVTNDEKKGFLSFLGKSLYDRMTEVCTTLDFTESSKRLERRSV